MSEQGSRFTQSDETRPYSASDERVIAMLRSMRRSRGIGVIPLDPREEEFPDEGLVSQDGNGSRAPRAERRSPLNTSLQNLATVVTVVRRKRRGDL
jgi:hypothetical protein